MLTWIQKPAHGSTALQPFNGIRVIQDHLEFRGRLENYVNGNSTEPVKVRTNCHPDCRLGKWLHDEGGNECKDLKLLDSIRTTCEEFHEAASQAVLLASMGQTEMARAALQPGHPYSDASERYQLNLVKLHARCNWPAAGRPVP